MHKAQPHINKITHGYSCGLTILPRFHGQFREKDHRANISTTNQVDTIYHFDAPHIRIQRFINKWSEDNIRIMGTKDHLSADISPLDIFTPMITAFRPDIVYSRDRKFGKLHFAMQTPNQNISGLYRITVTIENPADFSLIICTGLVNYRFDYGWDNRLVVC